MSLSDGSAHRNDSDNLTTPLLMEKIVPTSIQMMLPVWCQLLLFFVFITLLENQLISIWISLNKIKMIKFINYILFLIIKTVVGTCVMVLILPIFIPVYILFLSVKKLVMAICHYQYGDSVVDVSGYDLLFAVSSDNPVINALAKFEGEPNQDEYIQKISDVLNITLNDGSKPYSRFRQLMHYYYGYYIFRDAENFDLKNHIKSVDLNVLYGKECLEYNTASEMSFCADRLISKYLNDNGAKKFPVNCPKWEIVFFTYGKESEYTILFRLHHTIGDGIALLRILLETFSDTPTKINLLGPPVNPWVRFLTILWSIAFIPFGILLVFIGRKNPLHGQPLDGNSIYVTSKSIPFDSVKSIKKKTKTSVNDVLFSCLSSSVASFFKRRRYEVSDIGILFPIGFEDLSTPVILKNTFSMGIAALPTPSNKSLMSIQNTVGGKSKSVAFRRLMLIKENFDKAIEDPTLLSLYWISAILVSVLPSFICKILAQTNGKTMVVSNVPGPPHEVSILNRKVKEIWFWLPNVPPTGIGFGFMTYKGMLRISYHADRSLISEDEVEQILEDFLNALQVLKSDVEAS